MYELKPDEDEGETNSFQSVADVVDVIARATSDAMKELRGIASGLPLPELQRFSSSEAVERAIRTHERTTGTVVERNISALPPDLPLPVSICIFRVVQEGLTNAYCHAGGLGQTITGSYEDDTVIITVSDEGPGFTPETALKPGSNLGLRWLRQRVESIGGTLTVQSAEGEGTQLIAQFPYAFPAPEVQDVS
jgi:signal transduction histidine kinase